MRFDTNEVDDLDFELLPAGTYRFAVIDGDVKKTKAGTGQYVAIALQVLGGPHNDRRLFDNFNIENPNPQAQNIGRAQFKRFLAAFGIAGSLDVGPALFGRLNGKTVEADVIQQTGKDGVTRNKVKTYHVPQQGQAKATQQAKPTTQTRARPAPVADEAPPPDDIDVPF